jgi:hypothetical protein
VLVVNEGKIVEANGTFLSSAMPKVQYGLALADAKRLSGIFPDTPAPAVLDVLVSTTHRIWKRPAPHERP